MRALILLPTMPWLLAMAPNPPVDRFYDGHSPLERWDVVKVRKVHSGYGACVVRRNHADSVRLIADGVDNSVVMKKYPKLIDGDCLVKAANPKSGIGMQLPGDMLRYAIADALVARDLATSELTDLDRVAPLRHPVLEPTLMPESISPEAKETKIALRKAEIFMSTFGECVVRADPQHALKLLRTKVATVEEAAALTPLAGAFGKCAPGGASFKVNRTMMRGTIAVNYYRLAVAPRLLPAPGVTN